MPLQTLAPDVPTAQLLAAVQQDGGCIVRDRLSPERLRRFREQTQPLVDQSHGGEDDFSGRLTRRTGALIAASTECQAIVQDELVLDAVRQFLAPFGRGIQMMLTQIISIYPGESAQTLHRDRLAWGGFIPRSIEPQLNTMWALTDFTPENGATQVVPGSQTWDDERAAEPAEVEQAVMGAGSVLIYSGSIIHGGGNNRSNVVRMGLNVDYCLDWLRQEENQYLSCPPDIARNLPQSLTDLIGYSGGGYTLGYYSEPREGKERGTRSAQQAVGYTAPKDGLVV